MILNGYAKFIIILLTLFSLKSCIRVGEDLIDISTYSYPKKSDTDYYRIALFGSNDLHGKIFPVLYTNQITGEYYESGGAEYMATYIDILRSEWDSQFLWLDAGDQYQGGMEFSIFNGTIMNTFYNAKKLTAIGIGNHEFDFGIGDLKKNMDLSDFDYLSANIYNKNTQKYSFSDKMKRSQLYTIDKVKIGVIGLSSTQSPTTTSGDTTMLEFHKYDEIVKNEAKLLREKGANAVVLLAHLGPLCGEDKEKLTLNLRTKQTTQNDCVDAGNEFYKLMQSVGDLIDAAVAGHVHSINHHWVNGVPTIQSFGSDYSNVIYLTFDPNNNYKFIPEGVSIEGPMPSCGTIFEKTLLCNYHNKQEITTAGEMKPFKFHGITMEKDPSLDILLSKWRSIIVEKQKQIVAETEDEMGIHDHFETTLMNIFTDAGRLVTGADLTFMNLGGFRTSWFPGKLNEIDMFNMSPFVSNFVTFEMTGDEMIRMLKSVQGGWIVYPTSGVMQYFTKKDNKQLNLVDAKLFDGIKDRNIIVDQTYTICTSDYLANGGSAMKYVLKWYTMRNRKDYGSIRDYITDYLKSINKISKNMFINPNRPRVRFLPKNSNNEE